MYKYIHDKNIHDRAHKQTLNYKSKHLNVVVTLYRIISASMQICKHRHEVHKLYVCIKEINTAYFIDILFPLISHGRSCRIASIGDGVQDSWCGAARLLCVCRVPLCQNLPEAFWDHAMLIAWHINDVAAQRLQLLMK